MSKPLQVYEHDQWGLFETSGKYQRRHSDISRMFSRTLLYIKYCKF